jgi:hypothetical protein
MLGDVDETVEVTTQLGPQLWPGIHARGVVQGVNGTPVIAWALLPVWHAVYLFVDGIYRWSSLT